MFWKTILEKNLENEPSWGELPNISSKVPIKGVGVYSSSSVQSIAKDSPVIPFPNNASIRITIKYQFWVAENTKARPCIAIKFLKNGSLVPVDYQGNSVHRIYFCDYKWGPYTSEVYELYIRKDEGKNEAYITDASFNQIYYKLGFYVDIPDTMQIEVSTYRIEEQEGSPDIDSASVLKYVKEEVTNFAIQMEMMMSQMGNMLMHILGFVMFAGALKMAFGRGKEEKKEVSSKKAKEEKGEGEK